MSIPSDWIPSLQLTGRLAVEICVVVLLATWAARQARSVFWQKAFWQTALVAAGLLCLADLSGLSNQVKHWTASRALGLSSESASPAQADSLQVAAAAETAPSLTPAFRRLVLKQWEANRRQGTSAFLPGQPSAPASPLQSEDTSFLQGRLLPWIEIVWILGAASVLIAVLFARFLCWGILFRHRHAVTEAAVLDRFHSVSTRMGMRRPVRLFWTERLKGPAALGIFRLQIGLPRGFEQRFTSRQQEVVLAHELAHLVARDPLWHWIADIVAAILWWHPLVWWTRRRLRMATENAADEASLLVTDGPGVLAECLLQLATSAARREPFGALGATGPGFRSGLGKRVERLVALRGSWSPPNVLHSRTLQLVGPVALMAGALLTGAWMAPDSKGEDMRTIQTTWKRSLATLALLTGLDAAEPQTAAQPQPPTAPTPARPAASPRPAVPSVPSETPAPLSEVAPSGQPEQDEASSPIYRMDPRLLERYGIRPPAPGTPRAKPPQPPAAPVEPPDDAEEGGDSSAIASPEQDLMTRYGMRPAPRRSTGRQLVEAKLNRITFNEVLYDGIPLNEVLRDLSDQSRRRDPGKEGLNFLISNVAYEPGPPGIDPTTGAPIPQPARPAWVASQPLDSVTIHLRLNNVRLRDVLEAMVRVTEPAIRYSVEDYGVVFSPGASQSAAAAPALLMLARTFKVDTNTFLPGLESAFGIGVETKAEGRPVRSREVQGAVRQLLFQLGVPIDTGNRAVFYNDLTGILMVRATPEELDLVQAAVETLGGKPLRPSAGLTAPESGTSVAQFEMLPGSVAVLGKVTKQGAVPIPTDQRLDLIEAIARAGGFHPLANQDRIELSRKGEMTSYRFDELKRQRDSEHKVWLQAGDIINVREKLF